MTELFETDPDRSLKPVAGRRAVVSTSPDVPVNDTGW